MRSPTLAIVLRSLLFAIGQVLITLAFTPFALTAMVLPYRLRYRTLVQWTFLNIWWLERTCHLAHVVEGIENIPDTPTVVMCKHQSAWETMALQRYFAPQVWVLKRELLRIPVFGWGLAALRPIAINRAAGREALDQVVEQGRERLSSGLWVVVFPEGTRVRAGPTRTLPARRRHPGGEHRIAGGAGRARFRRLLGPQQLHQVPGGRFAW